jgi:hypothetical protein
VLKRLLFFVYGVVSYLIFLATFLYAIAFVGGFAVPGRLDGLTSHHHRPAPDQKSALVKVVRESTERFRDVSLAESEGYGLLFGCVSGPDWGAMGLHYVNLSLVGDGELNATRPEMEREPHRHVRELALQRFV